MEDAVFYRVIDDTDKAPISDYLWHGYETRRDFERALDRLVRLWKGRVGECIEERHGFLLLKFHDTPGCVPDKEWFPKYLLEKTEMPEYLKHDELEEIERELDEAYGF